MNPPPSFLRKTSCWFQRRQKENESSEAFCKDRQICLSGLVIKEKQKIKFSKCVKKERTYCNDITGTNFVCRVKGTSFSMNIDHLESPFVTRKNIINNSQRKSSNMSLLLSRPKMQFKSM